MAVSTSVFEAFPQAIEQGWQICPLKYSTITGNMLTDDASDINVIVDMGESTEQNVSPSASAIASDILLYCKPDELPTTRISALMASYCIIDPDGAIYGIKDAGFGKNQQTGRLEHIELKLKPIEASNGL